MLNTFVTLVSIYRIMKSLITDVLSGAVFQPLLDLLADPDIINLILEVAFCPEPSRKFPPPSGKRVEFLKAFVSTSKQTISPVGYFYYLKVLAKIAFLMVFC